MKKSGKALILSLSIAGSALLAPVIASAADRYHRCAAGAARRSRARRPGRVLFGRRATGAGATGPTCGSAAIGLPSVRAITGFLTAGSSAAIIGTTGEVTGSADVADVARARPIAAAPRSSFRIGLIADTHGLLRPEAKAFLARSDCIVHAGDIGASTILRELRTLAPLYAVRGNNDTEAWAARIPERRTLRLGGLRIYVVHDQAELAERPAPAGSRVIISRPFAQAAASRRGTARSS